MKEVTPALLTGQRALAAVARCTWSWVHTREGAAFSALLIFGAGVRLVLAPYHGFFGDVSAYIGWGTELDRHLLHYYSASGSNYPPLAGYISGTLVATCTGICHATPLQGPSVLALWMKVPTLVSELVTTAVLYALAREVISVRAAYVAAASYALAPAVLFDGAIWGQTDAIPTLFTVLALLAAWRGRGGMAGVALGLALMLKPQPAIFVLLVLLYIFRWYGWRAAARSAATMCGTCLVVSAPYLLPPHPEIAVFFRNVGGSISQAPFASVGAFNVWWFLGLQYTGYHAPLFGGLSAMALGEAGFGLVVVVALAGVWLNRSVGGLFAAAGVLATGFFMLTALQHERYLYPAIALFLFAAVHDHRYIRYYVVASVTTFLNMAAIVVLYYPGSEPGLNLAPEATWLGAHSAYMVVVAGVNIWLVISASTWFVLTSWNTWAATNRHMGAPREKDTGRADRPRPLPHGVAARRAQRATTPASKRPRED